jgi:hypothetical protein
MIADSPKVMVGGDCPESCCAYAHAHAHAHAHATTCHTPELYAPGLSSALIIEFSAESSKVGFKEAGAAIFAIL